MHHSHMQILGHDKKLYQKLNSLIFRRIVSISSIESFKVANTTKPNIEVVTFKGKKKSKQDSKTYKTQKEKY